MVKIPAGKKGKANLITFFKISLSNEKKYYLDIIIGKVIREISPDAIIFASNTPAIPLFILTTNKIFKPIVVTTFRRLRVI